MLDLIIRNVALPDERTGQDIGVKDGRIVEIRPALGSRAAEEIDGGGSICLARHLSTAIFIWMPPSHTVAPESMPAARC